MTRPFRDRLGESIRRSRIGLSDPLWADLDEDMREHYRRSADHQIAISRELGFRIEDDQP